MLLGPGKAQGRPETAIAAAILGAHNRKRAKEDEPGDWRRSGLPHIAARLYTTSNTYYIVWHWSWRRRGLCSWVQTSHNRLP